MPEHAMTQDLAPGEPQTVHQLGSLDRIPLGEARTFDLDGVAVAVFRTRSGTFFATQAHCPHSNGPLADGIVGGTTVICPLHAYRFDLASGRPLANDCAPLTTYSVTVSADGELQVASGPSPATRGLA